MFMQTVLSIFTFSDLILTSTLFSQESTGSGLEDRLSDKYPSTLL